MLENSYTDINSAKLRNLLKENNTIILDIRTIEEFQNGHIENAVNLPLDAYNIDAIYNFCDEKLLHNESVNLVIYCRSGARSLTFLNLFLQDPNFDPSMNIKIYHLKNGILEWLGESNN